MKFFSFFLNFSEFSVIVLCVFEFPRILQSIPEKQEGIRIFWKTFKILEKCRKFNNSTKFYN